MLDLQKEYEQVTADTMQAKYAAVTAGGLSVAASAVLDDRYKLAQQALVGTDLMHQLDPFGVKDTLARIYDRPWESEWERSMRRLTEANQAALKLHEIQTSAEKLYQENQRFQRELEGADRMERESKLFGFDRALLPPADVVSPWMFQHLSHPSSAVQDEEPAIEPEPPARMLGSVLDLIRSPEKKK